MDDVCTSTAQCGRTLRGTDENLVSTHGNDFRQMQKPCAWKNAVQECTRCVSRVLWVDRRSASHAAMATIVSNYSTPMDPTDLPKNLGRRLGDLSDLPEALRAQIVVAKLDDLEAKIIKTMTERFEGVANVDEIIVGLYRDHQYITEDRRQLAEQALPDAEVKSSG